MTRGLAGYWREPRVSGAPGALLGPGAVPEPQGHPSFQSPEGVSLSKSQSHSMTRSLWGKKNTTRSLPFPGVGYDKTDFFGLKFSKPQNEPFFWGGDSVVEMEHF
jgi:hypothetical protein